MTDLRMGGDIRSETELEMVVEDHNRGIIETYLASCPMEPSQNENRDWRNYEFWNPEKKTSETAAFS